MREEEPAPPPPIKPRPGPASGGCSTRAENEAAGGVRSAGGVRGAGRRPASPPPAPLPPRPGALPRPLPRAQRRSYRNSAGSWCRDAPRGGPGPRGRAPEVREEGEREKFEKQASRGEPDKPAPTPRPGSSTQTFRPARSLLRARRLPLQPGSFHTFRPAPSPRPPFPGPPLSSSGPGGAARPERPPELGPGSGCPVGSGPEPRATSTIASNSWNASSSPGEAREDGPEGLDKGLDNDAEGVWSPDIEQSFQEALAIYPPCGRRKIILSDEGKMYGRNELIARYIKLRTGKTRTRKQVSSHIQVLARKKVREYQVGIKVSSHLQVLARRKSREIQSKLKAMNLDQVSKDKALQSMASMSSAQIVSASVLQNKFSPPSPLPQAVFSTSSRFWSSPPLLGQQPGPSQDIKPFAQPAYPIQPPLPPTLSSYEPLTPLPPAAASAPVWQDRTIASSRLRLLEYSAFMEVQRDPDTYSKHLFVHIGQTNPAFSDPPLEAVDVRQIYDKFPEKKGGLKELYEKGPPNAFFLVKFWADLNSTIQEGPGAFYGVSSQYSSTDSMTISVSTKVCSFGKQVVEKVETEYARLENGRFVYRIHRSPMCEYMINFIHKLKHLPEKYMMNSVLENFTILQVVTSRDSQETLLVIAFVFEVSTSEHGAQHHVYKLVKD
ncbi:transcriptional enhancer factor TEF-5 isoform X7 [Canis lupus familiaris]|uniref:transcriptional enhancer factor TEF-5 isoform X7 n=1 Tax=Canis lupus familiaris TaxID=9615 RepID=UPI0018F5FC04|nr:transcriptional enhancer factor TEF-5 isoform X7 [Canis lupus familiaris]